MLLLNCLILCHDLIALLIKQNILQICKRICPTSSHVFEVQGEFNDFVLEAKNLICFFGGKKKVSIQNTVNSDKIGNLLP